MLLSSPSLLLPPWSLCTRTVIEGASCTPLPQPLSLLQGDKAAPARQQLGGKCGEVLALLRAGCVCVSFRAGR